MSTQDIRPLLQKLTFSDGLHGEALDVLAQLHGKDIPCDHPAVRGFKQDIDETLAFENKDGPWRFKEVFKNGPLKIRRRYILVIGKHIVSKIRQARH